ncbi:MAG TPA: VOC family protein [Daejeonella sp.]|nr:VOC family protein [Daejeonella sp.]
MSKINSYLTFNGRCREAMDFYQNCFGGKLDMQTFGESPMECAEADKDKIMHAHLATGDLVLMGSDNYQNVPEEIGNMITLSVNCSSLEEIDQFFNKFAEGGQVTMPLQDTFWGAKFGMLTDKFGIKWMFNCDLKQAGK